MFARKKILNIVGVRPNFVKIAALLKAMMRDKDIEPLLVHAGQHHDVAMSAVLFKELKIPKPHYQLTMNATTRRKQIAQTMRALQPIMLKLKPHLVVVVGDANTTLAAAHIAKKLGIRIAHIEAGLRSYDNAMPEEKNRILTDRISDYLFVTEQSGVDNLKREKITHGVYLVGNVMIDTLLQHKHNIISSRCVKKLHLIKKQYAVVTLHRPSNVDCPRDFIKLMDIVKEVSKKIKIIFPVHPRTVKLISKYHLMLDGFPHTGPLSYFDFLNLVINARFVLTDSGGVQEETTCLGIPCLTLRENTERPITTTIGTNILCGSDKKKILSEVDKILQGTIKRGRIPRYWDGKTSQRIVKILAKNLS